MTVKEIVNTAAALLSREDITAYLSGKNTGAVKETLPSINVMVTLANLVISELAGTYIPMVKSEQIKVDGGKIYYTDFSCTPLKIKRVCDSQGRELSYNENALYLEVNASNVVVEYQFVPPNYDLNDEIGYTDTEVSCGTLAFGVAAEYSICKGAFDEAVMWHKRYVESVNATRKVKNTAVKERSWL